MLNEGYVLYFVRPIMGYIVNKLFYEKHSQPKNCHFVFGSKLVLYIHSSTTNPFPLTQKSINNFLKFFLTMERKK
jgi:hypothetical protein